MDTVKMRICSLLLPDPGGEVVRDLLNEIDRLTAIVDKLPKTADGVPAVDNMRLYVIHPETGAISTWRPDMQPQAIKLRSTTDCDAYHEFAVSDSYSTLKAAEAAKGRTNDD